MAKTKKGLPKEAEPFKFKKGQSGNPRGRVPNEAMRALRKLTLDTYREVIELVLTGNLKELREMAEHPNTPAVQVGIASAFIKAIKEGDYLIIEKIAERIVGKIPDEINIHSKNLNTNLNSKIDPTLLKAALAELEEDV